MFDREAFEKLSLEFGGLAHWWVKSRTRRFSQDPWDEAMIRLYRRRDELESVEDQRERGAIALRAFSESLDRIEDKYAVRA